MVAANNTWQLLAGGKIIIASDSLLVVVVLHAIESALCGGTHKKEGPDQGEQYPLPFVLPTAPK